jgi:hypothetical protein
LPVALTLFFILFVVLFQLLAYRLVLAIPLGGRRLAVRSSAATGLRGFWLRAVFCDGSIRKVSFWRCAKALFAMIAELAVTSVDRV